MKKVCEVIGNKLIPCPNLSKVLEHGNPRAKSKGVFLPERINIKTGAAGTDIVQLHSGSFVGSGIALNFCPFCGIAITTWKK